MGFGFDGGKYGFQARPPLTVLSIRFAIAGALMLAWSYDSLPVKC